MLASQRFAIEARVIEALARNDAVRLVVVIEPATLGRAYSGWMAELKTNRSLLFLQPSSPAEIEGVAGAKPTLRPDQPFPVGRGVLVCVTGLPDLSLKP